MKLSKSLVWTLPLLLGTAWATEEVGPEAAVSKLLSEAKTQAFQVKEDAVTMESFNRMKVSHEAHSVMINQVRDHINALVATENKLQAAREEAAPWQKQVIARVVPFLEELNGYTSAVIEHLNGDTRHNFAEYKDYLEANADYATDLAKMIADFIDYGQTKDRMQHLEKQLEIPSGE